jgi:processive 1,2-diacylglycerol beta-glucosyltransferase
MAENQIKVLFLTSDYGEGHNQVAEALKQVLQRQHPEVEYQIVNVIERLHPRLHPIGRSMFLEGVKRVPALYGYLYKKTYSPNVSTQFLNELSKFGLKKLQRLLEEEKPQVVVSTFPFAAGAMSMLRERGMTDVPTVTVITDQTVHQAWVHANTDFYIVGSELVQKGLLQCGILPEHIAVTGIPIRPAFETTYPKYLLRARHQLNPDVPTVLLMGGGFGMFEGGMLSRKQLDRLPAHTQIVVICGHNEKAKTTLERELQSLRHHIVVKGFVDDIHEWMSLADLIITKPGGVSTSEAMALEVPMLLYKAIPGQEEENLRFLVDAGVAQHVATEQQLMKQVALLLQNAALLSDMKTCAQKMGRKQAAQDAVQAILRVTGQAQTKTLLPILKGDAV